MYWSGQLKLEMLSMDSTVGEEIAPLSPHSGGVRRD